MKKKHPKTAVLPIESQIKPLIRLGMQVEVTIESLAPEGVGLSKEFGLPIFVSKVAPKDKLLIEITEVHKSFARAKVVRLLEASEVRIDPPCKLFKVCGGCQWQHLTYDAQLLAKRSLIAQAVKHIGGLDPELVGEVIGAEQQYFYRSKVQFPTRHPRASERVLAGYYEQDSHRLVNIKHCPIQPKVLDEILELIKRTWEEHGLSVYDEKRHSGLLRFINARYSQATGKVLITLVVNARAKEMPDALPKLALEIQKAMPTVSGVCINFNYGRGNRILSEETVCLAGEPFIEEILPNSKLANSGLKFRLSSGSFFQIHTQQAVKLLEKIQELLSIYLPEQSGKLLIDAYAGGGSIAIWLSSYFKEVIAIEENPIAVNDGRYNLINNAIDNVQFILGSVETVLSDLRKQGLKPDLVILDPPRKGCAKETITALLDLAPSLILYVSCNPVTLARDLKLLETGLIPDSPKPKQDGNHMLFGYKTRQIVPCDLFPQTYHVEAIAVLTPATP